jgi:hypothetical protein
MIWLAGWQPHQVATHHQPVACADNKNGVLTITLRMLLFSMQLDGGWASC